MEPPQTADNRQTHRHVRAETLYPDLAGGGGDFVHCACGNKS